ncbi:NADH dehydrogenase [ubiquinone] 1 alpha subcomplex subunit 3 isoform X1 [Dendrobates tinctorius]|uniref:NADH dehydrogenase [ubiquinone] 1 alpha subcomplex subunit 3 isoform X1 n=1 Tax=Dendrobates tinctorius TaxID=92724 RepID=UPI003CC9C98A
MPGGRKWPAGFPSVVHDQDPRVGAFLKNAWNKEPVVTVSVGIGILAAITPFVSPYTKYASMYNRAVPYSYPVPVRDDGNMPDIPSHPCDKVGPNLDWLKNL